MTAQSGAVKTYTVTVARDIYAMPISETTSGSTTTITLTNATVKIITTPTVTPVTVGVIPTFPTTPSDATYINVPTPFIMAETDVTYQLWKEVYDWATSPARGTAVYSFANPGQNGTDSTNSYNGFSTTTSTQYPVTNVTWRDAIVWCNAFTEYYNANNGSGTDLAVVYCSDSGYKASIRTSTNSPTITDTTDGTQDAPYVNASAKGFRLPTSAEYEFAARYIGSSTSNTNVVFNDGVDYTNGSSASGATDSFTTDAATLAVAVFGYIFDGGLWTPTGVTGTAVVKSKAPNALGLYDMNGNVWKWNFDWYSLGAVRVVRGGAFSVSAQNIQVGVEGNDTPYKVFYGYGFRFSRSK